MHLALLEVFAVSSKMGEVLHRFQIFPFHSQALILSFVISFLKGMPALHFFIKCYFFLFILLRGFPNNLDFP